MAKILLIGMEPLVSGIGIRYLSSYLKERGHEAYVLFSPKKRPETGKTYTETETELDAIASFARNLDPDTIGISLMTHHYYRSVALTEALRSKTDAPVIWGGVHPTYSPEECAARADFVFSGESEISLAAFAGGLGSPEGVYATPGIAYYRDGEMVNNPSADVVDDLDDIPLLDTDEETTFVLDEGRVKNLDSSLYSKYSSWNGTWYRLTTSRGCPYKCAYCTGGMRRKVRRRSVDNVFAEVDNTLGQYPFTAVLNIQDDSFFLGDDDWLGEFCSRLRDGYRLTFMCRLMPRFVTEERIAMLYDGGLRYISMGLQTGSGRVNYEIYNRRETAEDFARAENVLSKFPVEKVYDVIFDNPYETEAESLETVRAIAKCSKPFLVYAYSLTPYPGTAFYESAKRDGYLEKMTDPYMSPFRVTDKGKYRTPIYLRRLLYISAVLPQKISLSLVNRAGRPPVKLIITLLYFNYRLALNVLNWVRARFPNLVVKLLEFVRKGNRGDDPGYNHSAGL